MHFVYSKFPGVTSELGVPEPVEEPVLAHTILVTTHSGALRQAFP